MNLTDTERIALQGIQARQMLAQLAAQRDQEQLFASIERRLRLKAGALTTTHGIETETWDVVPLPKAEES